MAERKPPHRSPCLLPGSVFLQNKARREDFCPRKLRQMHLMIDQLMAHSHLRYKGEGPQTTPELASGLLTPDPAWSLVLLDRHTHTSPAPLHGARRLMGSLPQVLCPCYSATSSLGSRPTSWTLRSTCSWCPSWTARRRVRPPNERVWLPIQGIWFIGSQELPWSGGRHGPTLVRG